MSQLPRVYIRLDKSIVINFDKIFRDNVLKGEETLIRNLLYFFSKDYERNFFNYGTLDPHVFAAEFGYPVKYLMSKHPQPYQFELFPELLQEQETDSSTRHFDSVLENALFILTSRAFTYSRETRYFDVNVAENKREFLNLTSLIILNSVNAEYVLSKDGKKQKVVYNYKINPYYIKNVTNYFVAGRKSSLIELRKSGLDKGYLEFVNVQNSLFKNKSEQTATAEYKSNFNHLCEIFDIPRFKKDGERYEKYKCLEKLKLALDNLKNRTELQFEYRFESSTTGYDSFLIFSNIENDIYKSSAIERNQIFFIHLLHNLVKTYKTNQEIDNVEEKGFMEWLKNEKLHYQYKDYAFRNAQLYAYDKLHIKVDKMAKEFFHYVSSVNMQTIDEMKSTLSPQMLIV